MVNPMKLMQLREMLEQFRKNHSKLEPFFYAARAHIQEGSIVEIKVTDPEGKELNANIRVTAEDMELLREAESMGNP